MSIADDGAGAAAQLISLNRGLFRLLAQSCGWTGAADAVTDSTACRSLLRDHILPHLEAAGWRHLVDAALERHTSEGAGGWRGSR